MAEAKHVVIIDDTEEILVLFREIVEGIGHRVSVLSYAPDDLKEVTELAPDLVIADLTMGEEKLGWQLVQKMRMSRQTEAIPILVCTAAAGDVRDQEGWLAAHAVKVLLKPFTVEQLETAVTRALGLPGLLSAEAGS